MTTPPDTAAAAAPAPRRILGPLAEHEIGLDWARTRAYMRADFDRALALMGDRGTPMKRLYWWLMPPTQALFWYRVSRWLYLNGRIGPARIVFLISYYVTGAELPPTTSIGPGCVIGHAIGTRVGGRIGARCTMWADVNVGGGVIEGDVGGGPGLPCIGDDVTLAVKSAVLGAVRIGDGVKVGPGCIVTRDLPARAMVFTAAPRVLFDSDAAPVLPSPAPPDLPELASTPAGVAAPSPQHNTETST
jgi:serine O-acetyltransferase